VTLLQVGIRRYGGDAYRHAYPVEQLHSGRWIALVPVCQDGLYPIRHPSDELDARQHTTLGGVFQRCEPCARALAGTDHAVLVEDDIVATTGTLPHQRQHEPT
jgi:hypothetical protein